MTQADTITLSPASAPLPESGKNRDDGRLAGLETRPGGGATGPDGTARHGAYQSAGQPDQSGVPSGNARETGIIYASATEHSTAAAHNPDDSAHSGENESSRTREAKNVTRLAIRPTFRAVLFFALSVPAALLIVTIIPQFWYASLYLPAAALAMMLADMVMAMPGRRLQADLYSPPRLYLGKRYLLDLALSSAYRREVPLQALLELEGETDDPIPVSGLLSGGALTLYPALVPRRRGVIALKALWLRWRGPLGLMEFRRRDALNKSVDIVPDIQGIHEAALQFFSRDAVYGVKTQRLRGDGTEFDTLCEYAQGMDSRFIDWKRSARHRKLLCKEFRQERNHQIVFGFDTGHLMLEPLHGMPKLDHSIKAALLLGWISLYSGDLVGGCGFDVKFRNFLKPGRSMPYFIQFQRFTAGLDYRTEETNFTLGLAELNARLQRRALIILFTEFVDSISAELMLESLQLLTRRHLVVFVTLRDPLLSGLQNAAPDDFPGVAEAVTAADFLRERAIVLERVARHGVHCLDVPAQEISSALLNKYLQIKQRGLL